MRLIFINNYYFTATLLTENVFPLQVLINCSNVLIEQGYALKFLSPIFKLVVENKGPNYLGTLWQQSGLNLSDIIGDTNTSSFIKDNVRILQVFYFFFFVFLLHIACFSSHPCLCLILRKIVSLYFSRPSSAPLSCR